MKYALESQEPIGYKIKLIEIENMDSFLIKFKSILSN